MSSISIAGDSSGAITLSVPAVAGTNTVTIPAVTGTVMVSSNMPAFSAYPSSAQTLSSGVATKIQLQIKSFDTSNAFDNATNYRFTPLVAGYYQVNASLAAGANVTNINASIYKNGSAVSVGSNPVCGANTNSALVYLNGSTDYVELYGTFNSGQNTFANNAYTYFQACLVRVA
jgi:hypothetical protein